MSKKLLIVLVVLAMAIWLRNGLMLFKGISGGADATTADTRSSSGRGAPVSQTDSIDVHFADRGRSPFVAQEKQTGPTADKNHPLPEHQPFQPPPIEINGIMWNATDPVAMVSVRGGESVVVRAGSILDSGLAVRRIEKSRVRFSDGANSWWVER